MTIFVLFNSAFRSERTPCISHVTVDEVKTLCGRLVSQAATREPDDRDDVGPDCNTCRKVWTKARKSAGLPCR